MLLSGTTKEKSLTGAQIDPYHLCPSCEITIPVSLLLSNSVGVIGNTPVIHFQCPICLRRLNFGKHDFNLVRTLSNLATLIIR